MKNKKKETTKSVRREHQSEIAKRASIATEIAAVNLSAYQEMFSQLSFAQLSAIGHVLQCCMDDAADTLLFEREDAAGLIAD